MRVTRRNTRAAAVIAAAALAAPALIAAPALEAKPTKKIELTANLKGKHAVPGPGDPDGSGKLTLTIRPEKRRNLCFVLDVEGLGGVREARIRSGAKGETGPGVLKLFKVAEPVTGEGATEGCLKAKKPVLRELKRDPGGHYADVENAGYPQGALRGQLRKRG